MKFYDALKALKNGTVSGEECPHGAYLPNYPGYIFLGEGQRLLNSSTGKPLEINLEIIESEEWKVAPIRELRNLTIKKPDFWRKVSLGIIAWWSAVFTAWVLLLVW